MIIQFVRSFVNQGSYTDNRDNSIQNAKLELTEGAVCGCAVTAVGSVGLRHLREPLAFRVVAAPPEMLN